MKALFLAAALVTLLAGATEAQSWSVELAWDATPGATSYRVEKSTDQGNSWVVVSPTNLTTPALTYTATDADLVLFRISGCNSQGCTIRIQDGLWHNEKWKLPGNTANLKTK